MLRVDNIEAGYGGIPVLRGVSLAIARNESVAIIGANGAGKSTLVRAICGLLPVSAGRIVHDDRPIEMLPAHVRSRHGIAVVLENRHLFGELSVRNNLMLAAVHSERVREATRRFTLEQVLELFPFMRARLEASVALLSGGEQQMVAIGRGLASCPKLLMLDEPSMGLAPIIADQIFEQVQKIHREQGIAILLVEQRVAEALSTCDHGYVLESGRIALAGTHDALLADPRVKQAYLGA